MVMASLTSHSQQKKSCCDTIRTNLYHLSDGDHNVADIVDMVMDEILSNSNATFQESQYSSDAVKKAVMALDNLTPETILYSKEQDMLLDLSKPLKDRNQDITFMISRSMVDCYVVDYRITTADSLPTHFSIRLPHHIFDISKYSVTLISPVASIPSMYAASTPSTNATVARTLFTTPGGTKTPTTATTTDTPSVLPFKFPKMGFLSTSSSSPSAPIRHGCYGCFDFLGDDVTFLIIFGPNPILLHGYSLSGS